MRKILGSREWSPFASIKKTTLNKYIKNKLKRKIKNKKLLKKYPWLVPRDWYWRPIKRKDHKYEFTMLDDMPDGWRKAFGDIMCEEIDAELRKHNFRDQYVIEQVKEKYGSLRWYTNFASPLDWKYETISMHVCINCGRPDTYMTDTGWDSPICEKCFAKIEQNIKKHIPSHVPRRYEDYIVGRAPIPDTTTVRSYSVDGYVDTEIDLKQTADKIRKRWKQ